MSTRNPYCETGGGGGSIREWSPQLVSELTGDFAESTIWLLHGPFGTFYKLVPVTATWEPYDVDVITLMDDKLASSPTSAKLATANPG